MKRMRGLFVTGTDTGVGKTVLAGAICAGLRARGMRVAAYKPVLTGLDAPPEPGWPPDHELLADAAGVNADEVAPHRYGPAVSPHLAAELAGEQLSVDEMATTARGLAEATDVLVVEGVGGLLVPLTSDASVRDLAAELRFPLVIAARPGLGTINHTLLTLEAAHRVGLQTRGVVLTPWPETASVMLRSNRETLERLGAAKVETLPCARNGGAEELLRISSRLPLERWLST